ncbi:MAG TPA: exo-alpha-sialidase [Steroidobacteraceae bacterium]|nr:exo-alpha-sialidase [Steroidobacteraceae bacterium]
MLHSLRNLSIALAVVVGPAVLAASSTSTRLPASGALLAKAERANVDAARISQMGARAALEVARLERVRTGKSSRAPARLQALTGTSLDDALGVRDPRDDDECQNNPRCGRGFRDGPRGGQAELSIAIDSTGQHIVIGFNDQRGFDLNPISVSGYMYSDDGGRTFVDGGQLPSPGDTDIGGTLLPQVFGDPEIKYLGGCTFVYSSILVAANPVTVAAQTMGVHRSTDCGHTWTGPFEVRAATNPFNPGDAADKEFMDVDPETGRLMMTWTNFGADGIVSILSAFSDNGGRNWPASSRRVISDEVEDGQSSVPRFAGNGSTNVYAAWRRFPFPGDLFGYGNTIAVARSPDNGNVWRRPVNTSSEFLTQDMILGNDRSNTAPALAVDNSDSPNKGDLYLVYPNNNNFDGSDIVFQRSKDRGRTWSAPLQINSRPGKDRPQWFPVLAVDDVSGRISVFYYDQGIATSGDLSEVTYTFSLDGGDSWSKPRPLTLAPFHAGHNNDTGQPNLGDYNQGVSQGGVFYAAYALANRPPLGFVDGQPDVTLTGIDATFRRVGMNEHDRPYASVNISSLNITDSGGNGSVDPGETADIRVRLFNYVTNPLNAGSVRSPVVTLRSETPGVTVLDNSDTYGTIPAGGSRINPDPFTIRVGSSFDPGTPIKLRFSVKSVDGEAILRTSLDSGSPHATTLLTQRFNGVAPGRLPSGWTSVHGAGGTEVPWTTSNTFCGPSNGAFHANDDVGDPSTTRWERLFSPAFTVPADSDYVLVTFDVCTDTDDDPVLPTTAYDGVFLRVTDLTTGRTLRSVLAEAFADAFRTGNIEHYPKHLPRSGDPDYFEDMSVWAGDSNGLKRVRMRLPGMQGSVAQLRFEFTQDSAFTCLDVRPGSDGCGVFIDNVVVSSVTSSP